MLTPDDYELAARRAVVQCYGLPSGYVPHCGYCGKAMQACACGTTPARDAAEPDDRPVEAARIIERYGVQYCAECNLAIQYCCHAPG